MTIKILSPNCTAVCLRLYWLSLFMRGGSWRATAANIMPATSCGNAGVAELVLVSPETPQ
ncbi:MAG: hypothetical protein CMQ13_00270 [Gammaproteobacteria bacterium]|nr:hypothetical protein [Gammaproteobacteria bacterium]